MDWIQMWFDFSALFDRHTIQQVADLVGISMMEDGPHGADNL